MALAPLSLPAGIPMREETLERASERAIAKGKLLLQVWASASWERFHDQVHGGLAKKLTALCFPWWIAEVVKGQDEGEGQQHGQV